MQWLSSDRLDVWNLPSFTLPPPPFFFEAPSFCCGAQALPSSPQKLLRNALQELGPRIQLFAGRNKDRSCPRELVTFVAGRKQHEGEIM